MSNEQHRATQKLKALTVEGRKRVRSAFGTKLVALGMGLVCLAGGIDYFENSAAIHQAVGGLATSQGQGEVVEVVETIDEVEGEVDTLKTDVLAAIPGPIRENLAPTTALLGLALLAWGVRVKTRVPGVERGRGLRDVGRVLLGPGALGVGLFLVITWQGAAGLRAATASFAGRLESGDMSRQDLWELSLRYAPWAWHAVGEILLLGAALLVAGVLGRLLVKERFGLPAEIVRRSAGFGSLLCLTYFAAVTVIAIASYGAALNVVAWPWKVNATAFLSTLAFMSVGGGLIRTGKALMKRESAAEAARAEADSDEIGPG